MNRKVIIRNRNGKVVLCRTATNNTQLIAFECFRLFNLN